METYERIRNLRKELGLNQTEFGKQLGVNRDVINNIENNRLARPEQKLSLYKLICSEFGINEDWLLNGTLPIKAQTDSFSLDEFAKNNGATELELKILKAYFELDSNLREQIIQHFKEKLSPSKEDSENAAIEKEVDLYRKQLQAEKRVSSASNITNEKKA